MVKKKIKGDIKLVHDKFYRSVLSPQERLALFREISINNQGFVLLGLSKHLQIKILSQLKFEEIENLLDYLDPPEATDILQNISVYRRKKIIKTLNVRIKDKVDFLLKFNPETAAGIMSMDYIEVDKKSTFGYVSKAIKKYEKTKGKFPAIFVVEDGLLIGELSEYKLVLHNTKEKINKYVKKIPTIQFDKNENEVIQTFKKHRHNKIVVLDEKNAIMGLIYSDDLLNILEKKSGNHLYDFAGVSDEESIHDSVFSKVKHRYKWLILNLATAFLASSVVSLFQNTISAFVLLAVYMPIIAGMGGNTGTQTLAIMVRGIALKEIDLKTGKKVIMKEVASGIINGVIIGIIVAIVATLFNQNSLFGLIVGVSMIINLMIAGFFGSIIPLIMKRLGKDPATSAVIFITTFTDLFGFFVFLGLASLVF